MSYDFDTTICGDCNYFGDPWISTSEGMIGPNDSGGPSLTYTNGNWQVVGVHRLVINFYNPRDEYQSSFGSAGGDMLAAPYRDWIISKGAQLWEQQHWIA